MIRISVKAKRVLQTTRAPPQRRREEEVITEEMARERTNEYLNAYDSENDENYRYVKNSFEM